MPAVFNDGYININDVTITQLFTVRGNAVTNDFVDRSANRFRKSVVVQRSWNGLLDVNDVVVTNAVKLSGCHAHFDQRFYHLQNISG